MPVIVIGADTELGTAVMSRLESRAGEVRAFVTDSAAGLRLKDRGVKVAVGDVSDGSHIESAALGCFSAVVIPACAFDTRERSFASDPDELLEAWTEAVASAGVRRVIWLEHESMPGAASRLRRPDIEVGVIPTVGRSPDEIADAVAEMDDAAAL